MLKVMKLLYWSGPILLVLFVTLFISFLISSIRCLRNETFEPFQNKSLLPLEKGQLLLPTLKCYLNATYPTRKHLSNPKANSTLSWQDLSGNNNDFEWNTPPTKDSFGFEMKGHQLTGPRSDRLGFRNTKELCLVLHCRSLGENTPAEKVESDMSANLLMNATLENEGKMKTMVIPAEIRSKFEQVKSLLKKTADQNTKERIFSLLDEMKQSLAKYPEKESAPIALSVGTVPGKHFSVRIPDSYGKVEVDIAGDKVYSYHRVTPENKNFYFVCYHKGTLEIYFNHTLIASQKVSTILLDESAIRLNPSERWNSSLQEVLLLNRVPSKDQRDFLMTKGMLMRSILMRHQKTPVKKAIKKVVKKAPMKPKVKVEKKNNYYYFNDKKISSDRLIARDIFMINYPKEKVPSALKLHPDTNELPKSCPFTVKNQMNPCLYWKCDHADWDAKDPEKANLNRACRRRIDAYCENFPGDEFCTCWRPEFWDVPECRAFRHHFTNKDCKPGDYPINKHPDFDRYIRKDRIPCFNCDLTQSS